MASVQHRNSNNINIGSKVQLNSYTAQDVVITFSISSRVSKNNKRNNVKPQLFVRLFGKFKGKMLLASHQEMDRQVSLDESDAAAMGILLTLKSQGKSGFLVEKTPSFRWCPLGGKFGIPLNVHPNFISWFMVFMVHRRPLVAHWACKGQVAPRKSVAGLCLENQVVPRDS